MYKIVNLENTIHGFTVFTYVSVTNTYYHYRISHSNYITGHIARMLYSNYIERYQSKKLNVFLYIT